MDRGTEFASKAMDHWAYTNDVHLDFIRPGRPVENDYIESFNGEIARYVPESARALHKSGGSPFAVAELSNNETPLRLSAFRHQTFEQTHPTIAILLPSTQIPNSPQRSLAHA